MSSVLDLLQAHSLFLIAVIVSVFVAWIGRRYLELVISDRKQHAQLRAEFYEGAHRILQESNPTLEKIEDLRDMSENINSSKVAFILFLAVCKKLDQIKKGVMPRSKSGSYPDIYYSVDTAYLLALTYLRPIIGRLTRAALAELFRSQDRDRVASTARQTFHNVHA